MEGWLTGLASGIKGAESGLEKALARKQKEKEDEMKKSLQDAQIGKLGAETKRDLAYADYLKAGKGGSGQKLTESELREQRLQQQLADEQSNLEAATKGYDMNSPVAAVEGLLPRFMQSKERQQFDDARKNYGLIKTFELSGAQAPASEREEITRLNTPQLGDSPETIEAKMKRQRVGAYAGQVRGKMATPLFMDQNKAAPISPQSAQAGQKPIPRAASVPAGQVIVTPDGKSWIKTPSGTMKPVE